MTSENYRDLELEGLKDTGLQAFMLHKLGRENPVRILQASQSVIDVLKGFDPPLALRTLDRLVETMGAKFVPFLQQLLKHDDRPIIRARVLYHLSRKDPSESTQRILNQVLNGIDHPRVRASCLSGLSRVRSKIPLKHIKSHLLNEDPRVRASALELLLAHDIKGMKEVFTLLLNDESPRVKALAATGLWRLGDPQLLDLVRDAEEPNLRRSLLHALRETGRDMKARTLLMDALGSSDETIRSIAATSLTKVAETEDIPQLIARAVRLPGRETKLEIIRGLKSVDPFYTARIIHSMIDRVDRRRDPRDLSSLITMAGELSSDLDLEQLSSYLDAGDGRVRANAIEVIGPRLRGDSRLRLIGALESEFPRVRANAAIVLWRAGYHIAMVELNRMLSDEKAVKRASSAYALGQIGGLVVESKLKRALEDSDERTRRLAYQALAA